MTRVTYFASSGIFIQSRKLVKEKQFYLPLAQSTHLHLGTSASEKFRLPLRKARQYQLQKIARQEENLKRKALDKSSQLSKQCCKAIMLPPASGEWLSLHAS